MSSPAVTRGPRPPRTPAPPPIAPWFPLVLVAGVAATTLLVFLDASQATVGHPPVVTDGDQSRLLTQPEEPGQPAALLGVGAFLTVVLGPLVAMLVSVWAGTWVWLSWGQLRSRDRTLLLVAAAVALGVVAFDFSSVGRDLAREVLD